MKRIFATKLSWNRPPVAAHWTAAKTLISSKDLADFSLGGSE